MAELFKNILVGMGSTMDIFPSDPPTVELKDVNTRLAESWNRTGIAIAISIDQDECEQAA